jgi:hypothetical protein
VITPLAGWLAGWLSAIIIYALFLTSSTKLIIFYKKIVNFLIYFAD